MVISDRLYDAIGFLIKRYTNQRPPELDDRSPVEILMARGFSLDEISQAYEFIFSGHREPCDSEKMHSFTFAHRHPVRVLDAAERVKLDVGAQGLIHMLSISGLLSSQDVESVIQTALASDATEVTSADLLRLMRQALGDANVVSVLSDDAPNMVPVKVSDVTH